MTRPTNSHVNEHGEAKRVYATKELAAAAADDLWFRMKRPYAPYLCAQKPDHWHIGHGEPDIMIGRHSETGERMPF